MRGAKRRGPLGPGCKGRTRSRVSQRAIRHPISIHFQSKHSCRITQSFAHKSKMKSASIAWLRSLPFVLVGPICGWLLFCMYGWAQEATLGLDAVIYYTCLLWAIGLMIHATVYVLFGLPLFHFGYRHPHALIWRTTFAITVSGILGYGACLAVLTLLRMGIWGGNISGQDLKSPLIGAIYGMWTAICALRQKPRSEPMDANLPSASQPPDSATR